MGAKSAKSAPAYAGGINGCVPGFIGSIGCGFVVGL